ADAISSILKEEPQDLSAAGRDVPPMLERIVHHCLEKESAARFQSASDIAFALEALSSISSSSSGSGSGATEAMSSSPIATPKSRNSWLVPALLGVIAVLLGAVALLFVRVNTPPEPPSYHQLTFARELIRSARFAPDQRTIVYTSAHVGSQTELFSLAPDSHAATSLGLKDADIESISPAGEMLLIQQRRDLGGNVLPGVLARASLSAATPRPVLSGVENADWGRDNQIAVARYVEGHFRVEYPIGHVLYEPATGYLSNVRVSPKGDWVAFAEHPTFGDDAGNVAIVDSSGRKRAVSPHQSSIEGVNWAPSGREVWFTSAEQGFEFQVRATDLSGHTRVVDRIPGIPNLLDIAHDGHVLLDQTVGRVVSYARGPGQDQEHDVSVQNWSDAAAISPDGQQIVLNDEGASSSPDYDVYVRASNGAAPERVGNGLGYDFSPDMKWVLSSLTLRTPRQLFLIPLGTGETKQITHDSIDRGRARFLPDGKSVVFAGIEPGHKSRIYVQAIDAGTARPISPEGVNGFVPTADGKFVFGISDSVALYPVDGQGAPRPVPGIHPDETIFSVSPDGRSVLVGLLGGYSIDVTRVDLATSRREPFKKIGPIDPAGITMLDAVFTPDGKYYAYSCASALSQLYLVEGLR
ncbi:MAG: hypothetical protein ACRD3B_10275, partial [Candidatus Sulfotelmatobacter sp.]